MTTQQKINEFGVKLAELRDTIFAQFKLPKFIQGTMCTHKDCGKTIYPSSEMRSDEGYTCIRCDGCGEIMSTWKPGPDECAEGLGPTRTQLSRLGVLKGTQTKLSVGRSETKNVGPNYRD